MEGGNGSTVTDACAVAGSRPQATLRNPNFVFGVKLYVLVIVTFVAILVLNNQFAVLHKCGAACTPLLTTCRWQDGLLAGLGAFVSTRLPMLALRPLHLPAIAVALEPVSAYVKGCIALCA